MKRLWRRLCGFSVGAGFTSLIASFQAAMTFGDRAIWSALVGIAGILIVWDEVA